MDRTKKVATAILRPELVLKGLAAVIVIYLGLPIVYFLFSSLDVTLNDSQLIRASEISVLSASIATFVTFLTIVPLVYLLVNAKHQVFSKFIFFLTVLPIGFPPLVSGLLLLKIIGPYGVLGSHVNISFTESFIGIVLAQIFVATPFSAIATRSAFLSVNEDLLNVYKTVGLTRFKMLTKVVLPSTKQIWTGGIILTWLRAFGEFGATILISYHPYSLPVLLYVRFSSTGMNQINSAITVSIVFGLIAVTVYFLFSQLFTKPFIKVDISKLENNLQGQELQAKSYSEKTGEISIKARETLERCLSIVTNLNIHDHLLKFKYVTLVGPTGAGKTTLLKKILKEDLNFDKKSFRRSSKKLINLKTEKSKPTSLNPIKIGYVAQSSPVISNKTVYYEVKLCSPKMREKDIYLLKTLGLDKILNTKTDVLSGGEKQRLGIYRALSKSPDVVLFDEPFANLDVLTKNILIQELIKILSFVDAVGIFVTHDINEGLRLTQLIGVVEKLNIVQLDTFDSIADAPRDMLVAHICGYETFVESNLVNNKLQISDNVEVSITGASSLGKVLWSVHPTKIEVISNLYYGKDIATSDKADESSVKIKAKLTSYFKTANLEKYGYFDIGNNRTIKVKLKSFETEMIDEQPDCYLKFEISDLIILNN